jgi:nanoRNase/pAp phosphatase (c-di-AMP/oligoRNAs hydrolase)
MKKILHVSHKSPDIDAIASMVWGKYVFGGDIFIPDKKLLYSTQKVLKDFKIDYIDKISENYDYTFIYDVSLGEDAPLRSEKYVLFDHHSKIDTNFFENAINIFHKANSANVINLYELSKKWKITLPKNLKFLFAIAIYSDTGMLKTARRDQLLYIAELMENHTVEDLMEYACPHRFKEDFLEKLANFNLKDGVLYGTVKSGDEFYGIVDSIFKVMDAKVLCCAMEGKNMMKFSCDKKNYQWLIQRILKPFSEKFNVKYAHTNLYGFTDFNKIIDFIKENEV